MPSNTFVFTVQTSDETLIDILRDVLNDHPECEYIVTAQECNKRQQQLNEEWGPPWV